MSKQIQKQRSKQDTKPEADQIEPAKQDEKLTENLDDLLADIDGVLETNAQEFVDSFIQTGGQ